MNAVVERIVFHPRMRKLIRAVDRRVPVRRWVGQLERKLDRRQVSGPRLFEVLEELGLRAGRTVFVHASMDEVARRVSGLNVLQLIRGLQERLGPEGTLLMPTYPFRGTQLEFAQTNPEFDVRRTPSQAGLMTEVFRRMPEVRRSLHPTHAVAAWGKHAAELVSEHHLGATFGESSPFYKLRDVDGLVVGLGVDLDRGFSILHVAEELDPAAAERFLSKTPVTLRVRDVDQVLDVELTPMLPLYRNLSAFRKRLGEAGAFRSCRAGGLALSSAEARAFIDTHQDILRQDPRPYY